MSSLSCFKAYDIRGKLGEELNDEIAYRIGRAYAQHLNAQRVVVGGDIRLTSESLKQSLAKGLMDAGCDVIDIGMTGTEEIYFAAFHLDVDGGIEVTASHNPVDYNGMKFVGRGAKPISGDSGLYEIQKLAESQEFAEPTNQGSLKQISILDDYVDHLLGYINPAGLKSLKLVVNAGNGAAGHVIDAIEARFEKNAIPIEFVKINHEPDGNFPNGIPNPLLPENRTATAEAVKAHGADMGIAWDGDFDRCFLFDEKGTFIEGYYIVGLLAEVFFQKEHIKSKNNSTARDDAQGCASAVRGGIPETAGGSDDFAGAKIVHDPRLTWNTIDLVKKNGGEPVQSKTGHAFIKERMRKEDAVYGGEMSAHHYFRDFAYSDSGMIPWLLVAELISRKAQPLSELVAARIAAYPASGEINVKLQEPQRKIREVEAAFRDEAVAIDHTDGLSMSFENWRFNLRSSNTEPVVRLNVESKADQALMKKQTGQLLAMLESESEI